MLWRQVAAGPTEFLVVLSGQADLSPAARKGTKLERGRFVHDTLVAHATRSQAPLLALLRARGAEHHPFWIVNLIWVRGDARLMEALARRPDVLRLDANPRVRADLPGPPAGSAYPEAMEAVEWNLTRVDADLVWSLGYTGRGAVVAGQDTGYQWNHPALIGKYRGWDGATASHDYHWHDAIHSGGGICGHDAPAPCDDNGHGTHTLGTMVGDDGGSNRIGMAPGARWIGCRNMDQGFGTPATYAECFQWFVAPTDLNGLNPDPGLAPDVINNSWTCPPGEGCSALTLQAVVENTVAAGIVVVASAGNAGSACASVSSPPAIYAASLAVGATDSLDQIAPFSSRGPVTSDGSGRRKPDVCAPGVSVRSSVPVGSYATLNGTSMAGPHVAGLVALLLEARPDLRGRVDEIRRLVELSAVPLTSTQDCGGTSGLAVPNNTFGYGRIDALSLMTGDADGDGTGNLGDCRPADAGAWSVPAPATDLAVSPSSVVSWLAPDQPGAVAPTYDLLRSTTPSDFTGADCVAVDLSGTEAVDSALPGVVFYYLVRVNNACGSTLGSTSGGLPREGPICH
jgi:subtilisin family serine protease